MRACRGCLLDVRQVKTASKCDGKLPESFRHVEGTGKNSRIAVLELSVASGVAGLVVLDGPPQNCNLRQCLCSLIRM